MPTVVLGTGLLLAIACGRRGTESFAPVPTDTTALPVPTAPSDVPPTTVLPTTRVPPTGAVPPTTGGTVPPGPGSGVRGTVMFSPVCPVERYPPDPACAPRPGPANVKLVRSDGAGAGSTRAGDDGRFVIPAPPGSYGVEATVSGPGIGRGCDTNPSQVTVDAGTFSEVGVSCDTGIR